MQINQSIGDRLKLARKLRGRTQVELAKGTGLKQGTIAHLEVGRSTSSKHLPQLAGFLDVSYEWLLNGSGDMNQRAKSLVDTETRLIPVRSFADLTGGKQMSAIATDWLHAPRNAGKNSFAVLIDTESMSGPGRSYPPGTYIIVDPDKKDVVSGQRIVAKVNGDVTFREIRVEMGQRLLVPMNPQYPTIVAPTDIQIIGTVIGSYLPE